MGAEPRRRFGKRLAAKLEPTIVENENVSSFVVQINSK